MANTNQPKKPKYSEKTILAVQRFINSRSWQEAKQMVEENKRILLGSEAEAVINEMEAKYARSIWGTEVWVIEEHHKLLNACKKDGIDAAFATRVPKKKSQ
jgi:hypothetical protein